jgi:hypothetical protein
MAQSIDLSGISGKIAVTLLVIRLFPDMLGKSVGCAKYVLLTAVSRFNDAYLVVIISGVISTATLLLVSVKVWLSTPQYIFNCKGLQPMNDDISLTSNPSKDCKQITSGLFFV